VAYLPTARRRRPARVVPRPRARRLQALLCEFFLFQVYHAFDFIGPMAAPVFHWSGGGTYAVAALSRRHPSPRRLALCQSVGVELRHVTSSENALADALAREELGPSSSCNSGHVITQLTTWGRWSFLSFGEWYSPAAWCLFIDGPTAPVP